MQLWVLAIAAAVLSSGCMTTQLRKRANELASSIPDVYYQQVLDNLAMIAAEPARMPYFSDPTSGRTDIAQAANMSYGVNWDLVESAPAGMLNLFNRYLLDKQTASITGGQTNTGEWTAATDDNPTKLIAMRCVYRRTLGISNLTDEAILDGLYLHHYVITEEKLHILADSLPSEVFMALFPKLKEIEGIEFGTTNEFADELGLI
jgi:hypothetical protein